jgi:hypothetical protein
VVTVVSCYRSRRAAAPGVGRQNAATAARILYLVGGAPRVGKSTLTQRLLASDGIPWLPTDVVRTVLRRVLPELDAVDQDPVDASHLAELCTHTSNKRPRCAPRKPSGSSSRASSWRRPTPPACRPLLRAYACGHASSDTAAAPPATSPRTRGPKPSTRRRPPPRNSTRRPPGFDTGAISCANSAVRKDCPTSTWAHTAQAEHCAMETCGGSFGYLARSMSQHRGVHGSVG